MNNFLLYCVIFGCICVVIYQYIFSPVDDSSGGVLPIEKNQKVQSTREPKHRVRRYLNLPEGASVQLVYCFLMTALGSDQYFTLGLSLGLAWEVPSSLYKLVTDDFKQHRRDKRDLYPKIAIFIDKLGYDGEKCVQRFLCETRRKKTKDLILIEKLFQVIFTYQNGATDEPIDKYDFAHTQKDCSEYEDTCPISLFLP